MTVFLVYQTTPLLGGIRPICCYESQKEAENYCRNCNMHGDGFSVLELNMYKENKDV